MIEAGCPERVDAVFGIHVWPDLPLGKVGIKAGPLMAASDHFTVTIKGKPSHAARPDEGIDALVAGAQFVMAAQTIVSRNADPMKSVVITIGRLNAGTRYNIIAGECVLKEPAVRSIQLSGIWQNADWMRYCPESVPLQAVQENSTMKEAIWQW